MNEVSQGLRNRWIGRLCRAGRDDSGVTFIEVVVTLVMVVAAVVVTMYSLYFGNRALDVDMHKQQVLRVVQQELEYWIGRMYTSTPGDPAPEEMTAKDRYKSVILDENSKNEIEIWLSRGPIQTVIDPNKTTEQGLPVIAYWKITVWAEWEEPDGQEFTQKSDTEISLTTYVTNPN